MTQSIVPRQSLSFGTPALLLLLHSAKTVRIRSDNPSVTRSLTTFCCFLRRPYTFDSVILFRPCRQVFNFVAFDHHSLFSFSASTLGRSLLVFSRLPSRRRDHTCLASNGFRSAANHPCFGFILVSLYEAFRGELFLLLLLNE